MSQFTVEVRGINAAIAALRSSADNIQKAVEQKLTWAVFDLVRYVKGEKLSDQVLRVRTGRLRRSITGRVENENGKLVGIVGTNVRYARVHELGFNGAVPVKAHNRKIKGKAIPVRAHQRNMNIPARPFLLPSLQERWPTYEAAFGKAVEEGARAARP